MRRSFGEVRREGRLEPLVACGVACLLLAVAPQSALAWPDDPLVNVRLSTGVGSQFLSTMIPDGAGGAIVVWDEFRDNYAHAGRRIVAQKLGAPGAGGHEVDLGAGRNVPAGLYFVRLRQGVEHRVRRVVVVD